jgi:hypothetical protein
MFSESNADVHTPNKRLQSQVRPQRGLGRFAAKRLAPLHGELPVTQLLRSAGRPDLIENNQALIPNYGERWRYGETISTAFVESTINQVVAKRFVKKQQMQWTKEGAHLLLQTRTAVLNGELDEAATRRNQPHSD